MRASVLEREALEFARLTPTLATSVCGLSLAGNERRNWADGRACTRFYIWLFLGWGEGGQEILLVTSLPLQSNIPPYTYAHWLLFVLLLGKVLQPVGPSPSPVSSAEPSSVTPASEILLHSHAEHPSGPLQAGSSWRAVWDPCVLMSPLHLQPRCSSADVSWETGLPWLHGFSTRLLGLPETQLLLRL